MTASTSNGTTERAAPHQQERITVALTARVSADLQRLLDRTDMTKTDLVNRAITLYEFVDAQQSAGRDVLIRDNETGEVKSFMFL
jgi:hypothetical protein